MLGMKKLFELHDYIENMKVGISIFSIKGKAGIWWEDVKHVRDIRMELRVHGFKRLLRKHLSGSYYESMAKEFYEVNMGSMIGEEYMTKFLELLRYVPHIEDEKTRVHRLISGLLLTFKDWIEYDEPQLLEEVIGNLKHYYEQ